MSWIFNNTATPVQLGAYGISRHDDGVMPVDFMAITYPPVLCDTGMEMGVLWPATRALGGSPGYNRTEWERPNVWTGVHRRKLITGLVVDASSNPVSGATVNLYNTSTGIQVDTQTSASDGTYIVGDPNNVNCFVTAISGATQGITINTLTGT